ncbi:MAG: precorrin-2 C(20)-methyltransferase [Proteobacteria bacterium]|nr:precorrin-2 C(20)-methyltransferase [Pseudomonadota bacterium]MBU1639148.1 precorrin-2 C(20)-methyltransferase [Pseudomonadota bacterium]
MNTFYIIGTGPGDPELITVKALRTMEKCATLVAPKAKVNGDSTALGIVKGLMNLESKRVLEVCFPMHKVLNGKSTQEVEAAWQEAARLILHHLKDGDVAFPTLGDPAVYSTGFYVYATLKEMAPEMEIKIIPGITAMSCCSATGNQPLCLGGEVLSVVPATFDDMRLRQIITSCDSVVLMKVHNVVPRLITLLDELNLIDKAVCYEQCGMVGEKVHPDLRQLVGRNLHYFSTIIIRK